MKQRQCIKAEIGNKLYAYELGLLSGEEREQFEQHLIECDYCFSSSQSLIETTQSVRFDPEMRQIVEESVEDNEIEQAPKKSRSTWWGLPLLAAAALVILVLTDWRLEFSPHDVAVASENLLTVITFEDISEDSVQDRLGEVIADLLITDISESRHVVVSSGQRVYDILKGLGHEGQRSIAPGLASEIALEAGARWMLTGRILQVTPTLVVTSQVVDVRNGTVVAAQRVDGRPGETVFDIVDRLTPLIKNDLSLPTEALHEYDPPVRSITTSSETAYISYLNGLDLYYKYLFKDAERYFSDAISADTTFALAYYRRYLCGGDSTDIITAVRLKSRTNDLQSRYIEAVFNMGRDDYDAAIEQLKVICSLYLDEKEAHYFLGRIYSARRLRRQSIDSYLSSIKIDPYYKRAYNPLSIHYAAVGDLDSAIWAINRYIDMAPNEPMPYHRRGDLYARCGNTDAAIASLKRAIQIYPDFEASQQRLADLYILLGRYDAADSMEQAYIAAHPALRDGPSLYGTRILRHQGRFREALELQADAAKWYMEAKQDKRGASWAHFQRAAMFHFFLDNPDSALQQALIAHEYMREYDPLTDNTQNMMGAVAVELSYSGRFREADSVLHEIKTRLDSTRFGQYERLAYFKGLVLAERGECNEAIPYLEDAYELTARYPEHFELARAYVCSGRIADAVSALEQALNSYDGARGLWPDISAMGHYYLGVAYEQSGWVDRAIGQYEMFLNIWSNADEGLASVDDARRRLAILRHGT